MKIIVDFHIHSISRDNLAILQHSLHILLRQFISSEAFMDIDTVKSGRPIFQITDHVLFDTLKRVQNLKSIYESGILEELENNFIGATIILFGSYSKGEDTIKSDIDIAVIGRKEKEINLSEFESCFKKEIVINFCFLDFLFFDLGLLVVILCMVGLGCGGFRSCQSTGFNLLLTRRHNEDQNQGHDHDHVG